MPLDPQIAGFLDYLEQAGYPPMHEGTPEDARKGVPGDDGGPGDAGVAGAGRRGAWS